MEHSEPAKTSISAFGLEVQPLTEELAKPLGLPAQLKGVVVSSVKEGSPASEAGIQEGDVITKVVRNRRIQPMALKRRGVPELSRLRPMSWRSSSSPARTAGLSRSKGAK